MKNYFHVFGAVVVGIIGLHQVVEIDIHKSSPCLLKAKNNLKQFIRKPLNCSVCLNMNEIDSLDFIDKQTFELEYGYSGRPLVVRGAAKTWKAIESFNFEFFKKLNNISDLSSCQFLTYNDEFHSLDDVFQIEEQRVNGKSAEDSWYCGWSVCDPMAVNILRKYYKKPYFLPDTSENYIVDWIFMGATGYGANLHIDDVKLPSWQAQITGGKRWTIKTPPECLYTCKEIFYIDLWPGDIIVLETNLWYHGTEVISKDVSITVGAEYD